jgi:RTX calcium-binding nonapeptide repeat (4 copies)
VLKVAAPAGEANDLTITPEAEAFVIRDAGAPLVAGAGCVGAGEGAVRCGFRPSGDPKYRLSAGVGVDPGDGADRVTVGALPVVVGAQIRGGDGDDALAAASVPGPRSFEAEVRLDGEAGADTLLGGDGPQSLRGGAGVDTLQGGAGDDRLSGDGTSQESAPLSADVLDGGAGTDEADYRDRERPVIVDLADETPDGEAGEGDRLSSIENVAGGRGGDTIAGNDLANSLSTLSGARGRLIGRGGDDVLDAGLGLGPARLDGGAGDDTLIRPLRPDGCGAGNDTVMEYEGAVPPDCEHLGGDSLVLDLRSARLRGREVRVRVRSFDGTRISGTLSLFSGGRVIGRTRLTLGGPNARTVTVRARRPLRRRVTATLRWAQGTRSPSRLVRVRLGPG